MREETLSSLQVSVFNIGVMSDVMERAGIDPTPAFEAIGLDPVIRLPPTGSVSARAEFAFERVFLALTTGRRDLWIEVGRRHRLYAYGVFGLAIGTAPTLRDWVAASRLTRDLCFSFIDFRPVERNGRLCGIEFAIDAVPPDMREMSLFRDFGAASSVLAEMWQGPMRGFCLELTLGAAEGELLQRLFPFKVRFDSAINAVTWPGHISDVPLPNGSAYLHRYYTAHCEAALGQIQGSALEARITRLVMLDPASLDTVESVARRLNMSVRTLQRRLHGEGATFRDIVSRAQSEVAKLHLQNRGLSIAEVAAELGYSDRASFDLAFTRWTGVSPRRFRDIAGNGAQIGLNRAIRADA